MSSNQRRDLGFTLTELMVALVLGALVVLAATAMVVTSRGTYRTQDEATRVQESARFGLELMNRLVRLAGYTNFGDATLVPAFYSSTGAVTDPYSMSGPNVVGADNSKPTTGSAINGSDALVIRFYGSGDPGLADGNILDCAGAPVSAPLSDANNYLKQRAYDVLFVENDTDGEPSLKCQRKFVDALGAVTSDVQTLIRGVETFQVLYGEGNYAGGDPDSTLPVSISYRTGVGGANPVVNWDNVVTIRVAMLLRSNVGAQADSGAQSFNLFGSVYQSVNGSTDSGTTFATTALSNSERTRIRRVVETTIFVRNRVSQWPALN